MNRPVPVSPTEQDAYLLKKCRWIKSCMFFCVLSFICMIPCMEFGTPDKGAIAGALYFIFMIAFVALKMSSKNACPQCGKNFFQKWSFIAKSPNAAETKKCVHCSYQLPQ